MVRPSLWVLAFVLSVAASVASAQPKHQPSEEDTSVQKVALLVGCTKYPKVRSPTIRELHGPSNDLPLFARLLKEKFGFADDDITILKGTDVEQTDAPTRANIVKAFEQLEQRATANSQIVILISGHGTQVPAQQDMDEPDGLDEIFLPMDVQPWSGSEIPSAIRDDEFGVWLDRIRRKGAYVWAIFDCCHSGTMFRGPESEGADEVSRQVSAEDLGVPPENMQYAQAKREKATSVDMRATIGANPSKSAGGLAIFYAAQPFEETPELPRPRGAPRKSSHIYGLFTYMIVQTLQQQQAAIEYRDLSQAIVDAYRRERGSRGPTPLFDGDLNRQVLGAASWPTGKTFQLVRRGDVLALDAGELHGLTAASVLAVHPPAGDKRDRSTVLSYVRITTVTPFDSEVEPSAFGDTPAIEVSKIPDRARCQLVLRDVGDMHVKIATAFTPGAEQFAATLQSAVRKLAEEPERLVSVQPASGNAEWWLHCVTKPDAKRLYDYDVPSDAALLVQQIVANEKALDRAAASRPQVFASYLLADPGSEGKKAELSELLRSDMQKVFTWQNLWRMATSSRAAGKQQDVHLSVRTVGAGSEIVNPTVLMDQQRIQVVVENEGIDDWYVVLLYLDRNLGIRTWISEAIQAKSSWRPRTATIDGSAPGTEGLILIAYPLAQRRDAVASYLAQDRLGLYATRDAGNAETEAEAGPFARLLRGAAANRATRGLPVDSPEQPLIQMHTWITEQR